jgi:hypothetical protein
MGAKVAYFERGDSPRFRREAASATVGHEDFSK